MNNLSPFHEGEQQVQNRLGVRDAIEPWARQVVRPYLPDEHRAFHTHLPFLVAAARDAAGRPWVSLLAGPDGFVSSPDAHLLHIDARPFEGDALDGALIPGAELGLLGIDLASRRRNRVNGRIGTDSSSSLAFEVEQSFGNCPQYIHERTWRRVERSTSSHSERDTRLNPVTRRWIESADTFFIASGHRGAGENAAYGMDASHRGGDAGFVHVESDSRLVIPDYAGNNHYNTIGNLVMDPRAGLLFVDFASGSLLQLSGRATIDWDSPELARHANARSLIVFEIEAVVELTAVLPLRWDGAAGAVRELRVVDKVRESDDVTSFLLAARDGGPLGDFEAGQHLPVELRVPGHETPVRRTYSLSGAAGRNIYRISVKREPLGQASRHLHDRIETDAIISAGTPAGDFLLAHNARPVALLSAGVGVTPMVSMLHTLAQSDESRTVSFLHGARDGRHHPLADDARRLASDSSRINVHVRYSQPRPDDIAGRDYDSEGRVDCDLIEQLLPDLDAEFYLCGPMQFMAGVSGDLIAKGVPPERIHAETFGPIS